MQDLQSDCGVAAIKTVLQQNNIQVNRSLLFSNKELGSEGYSLYDIEEELEKYGVYSDSYLFYP